MRKTNIITETFETGVDGFLIDIVEAECDFPVYEAWLYSKEMGGKMLMFGQPQEQNSKEEFLQIVKNNLVDYITMYIEKYGER